MAAAPADPGAPSAAAVPPAPDEKTRWRCRQCGNLTRFDVTRASRVVEYVHFDLAGAPAVEEREVLSERIEQVRCRWCDAVNSVDLVARKDSD
jgi:hypothetical protein